MAGTGSPSPPAAGRGRPKGSLNKRSIEFLATLEAEDFNPAKELIDCYREARKTYDNYAVIYDAIYDAKVRLEGSAAEFVAPPEDKADKYLKIAVECAKDLASYAFPKLKAIEQSKDNPLKDMTPEQRLEAMKQAVAALELQAKDGKE